MRGARKVAAHVFEVRMRERWGGLSGEMGEVGGEG